MTVDTAFHQRRSWCDQRSCLVPISRFSRISVRGLDVKTSVGPLIRTWMKSCNKMEKSAIRQKALNFTWKSSFLWYIKFFLDDYIGQEYSWVIWLVKQEKRVVWRQILYLVQPDSRWFHHKECYEMAKNICDMVNRWNTVRRSFIEVKNVLITIYS